MKSSSEVKKYQPLLIAVSLFLVLFVAVLGANFLMQQSIVKSINYYTATHDVALQYSLSRDNTAAMKESVSALKSGAVFKTSADVDLILPELQIEQAELISSLKQSLDTANAENIQSALTALVNEAEDSKQRKEKLALTFLLLAGVFAIVLYVVVLLQVLRRLNDGDVEIESSQKETANIMATVSEGLFLIGKNHEIGVEQSKSLRKMFDRDRDLEGNFFEFIRQYVTEADVDNAKDYIEILFGERVKEKLIEQLNPLSQVKVHIRRLDGSFEKRYLKFKFSRVMEGGKLSYLLVSTTDITRQVLLEIELEETKERQDSQIDLLMSILHVNSDALSEFFISTEACLNAINNTLKEGGHNHHELHEKTNAIYRYVHKLKGDSANLNLYKFEALTHEIEDELAVLRENKNLAGEDLLSFAEQLKGLYLELDNMKSLVSKIAGINAGVSAAKTEGTDVAPVNSSGLQGLVSKISQRMHKPVLFNNYGVSKEQIPSHLQTAVNDIATQLIRNSIAHGVEESALRSESGKSSVAQVVASFKELPSGEYELVVQDDGAGIDEALVLEKALSKGLIKESQVEMFTAPGHYAKLLFAPGFSTKDGADIDAGRGVGLDLVRNLVKENHGRIGLHYQAGKFCRFRIVFPSLQLSEVA